MPETDICLTPSSGYSISDVIYIGFQLLQLKPISDKGLGLDSGMQQIASEWGVMVLMLLF